MSTTTTKTRTAKATDVVDFKTTKTPTSTIPTTSTTAKTCEVFKSPCIDTCTTTSEERQKVIWEHKQSNHSANSNKPPSCEVADACVNSCAAYGRVCPCAARIAAHAACKTIQQLLKDSKVFVKPSNSFVTRNSCNDFTKCDNNTSSNSSSPSNNNDNNDFPYLNAYDIIIHEKLGAGGFSQVNACTIINNKNNNNENNNNDQPEEKKKYAIKYLKKTSMVDLHQFKHGASDLAVEAFVLHRLSHPNIVKLYGVTAGSIENAFSSGKECGYFLIIDRLYTTLEHRIDTWRIERESYEQNHGGALLSIVRLFDTHNEYRQKRKEQLFKCIIIAIQIADAMEYIHSLHLIYRDLKPDNIGFILDEHGNEIVKLFDFGLIKELKEKDRKTLDGRYHLTGNTGSRRYMSPEVALDKPYNQLVDVYSFGIMLWEMCTTEKPFANYTAQKHQQSVVMNDERPSLNHNHTQYWPANLVWLIKHCWSKHSVARPTFTMIKSVLNDIINEKYTIPKSLVAITASVTSSTTTTGRAVSLSSVNNGSDNDPPITTDAYKPGMMSPLSKKSYFSRAQTTPHVVVIAEKTNTSNTKMKNMSRNEDPIISSESPPRRKSLIDGYKPGMMSPLNKKSYFSQRSQSTPQVVGNNAIETSPKTNPKSTISSLPPQSPSPQFPNRPLQKILGHGRAKTWGFVASPINNNKKDHNSDHNNNECIEV